MGLTDSEPVAPSPYDQTVRSCSPSAPELPICRGTSWAARPEPGPPPSAPSGDGRRCAYHAVMAFADEKYVLLTTFKRDGTPVSTPVWCTPLGDDEFGFWTSSGSGKAKRLAHTERVTVQPSNARGKVHEGTEPVDATARLVTGDELEQIRRGIVDKYGFMTKVTKWLGTIGGIVKRNRIPYGDRGVVVTLAPAPEPATGSD